MKGGGMLPAAYAGLKTLSTIFARGAIFDLDKSTPFLALETEKGLVAVKELNP